MAMVTSSLRPSPFVLHCVSRRNPLATASRRNVLISIRLKSTDVSQVAKDTLPWSDYLAIRKGKRKWEMVRHYLLISTFGSWFLRLRDWNFVSFSPQALTIPCVLAGLAGGAAYFGSMELDATKPIMVREASSSRALHHSSFHRVLTHFSSLAARPWVAWASADAPPTGPLAHRLYVYLGGGYLLGPIIGSTLWRVTHRRTMALIEARDREFHQHIVKNRVDPTAQSATNPVPDFYGE